MRYPVGGTQAWAWNSGMFQFRPTSYNSLRQFLIVVEFLVSWLWFFMESHVWMTFSSCTIRNEHSEICSCWVNVVFQNWDPQPVLEKFKSLVLRELASPHLRTVQWSRGLLYYVRCYLRHLRQLNLWAGKETQGFCDADWAIRVIRIWIRDKTSWRRPKAICYHWLTHWETWNDFLERWL